MEYLLNPWGIAAIIVGFYVAFTIGANDVANAMGTSVGSRAITIAQAVLIAATFEFLGSVLVGSHVTNTIRKGIIDPMAYAGDPKLLLYGMFSALLATGIWIHLSTTYGMPISTTHSIVGAVIGFGIISRGLYSISWGKVVEIVLSWVTSPVLGGLIGYFIYKFISRMILNASDTLNALRKYSPFLVFLLGYIITLSFLFKGLKNLHLNLDFIHASMWGIGVGIVAALFIFFISKKFTKSGARSDREELMLVEKVFGVMQIISACSMAFSHGANDVANAIGPVAAIINILKEGQIKANVPVPVWLLALGGGGIVAGLGLYGYKVIKTIGEKITELTPTRGFSAEFAAATTVLLASKMGLPISTTHTLVGSVVGVGLARGLRALNLRMMRDIIISWLLTLPLAAGLTIIIYEILKAIF